MKKVAFVLIGIPGSGKSTFARKLLDSMPIGSVYLSLDQCRLEVNGDEDDNSNFGLIKSRFYKHLDEAGKKSVDIVIDNTNTKPNYRKKIVADLRSRGWEDIIGLQVNCTVDQSMINQQNRERKVSRGVVGKMFENLSKYPPSKEEGFDFLIILD